MGIIEILIAVIFVYGIINSGNIGYGILALLGLCFVHLGVNIIDDYFDYKSLIKQVNFDKTEYLKNSQKTKCRYLVSGAMKESKLLCIAITYFSIALFCAIFFFLKCGMGIFYFVSIGIFVSLLYPFVSKICLSEVFVALAYGPALFGGVYYVMTGTCSANIFILSIPTMLMTTVLLYIHTVMDYEYDLNEGKATIANRFDSQLDSLIVLKILLVLAYISLLFLCIFDILDWQVFLVFLTIPLAKDLYKSLQQFSCSANDRPIRKWYHFPMENLSSFQNRGEDAFMFRMFQARNLMVYFSLILVFSIILSLAI